MEQTIEEKTAAAVLQKSVSVRLGGRCYEVSPPSIATLIEVSALVSQLPKNQLDSKQVFESALAAAKDCMVLGKIIAVLILGAKNTRKHYLFGIFPNRHAEKFARRILYDSSPSELAQAFASLMAQMQIADFFALTASLIEVNMLRRTREAVAMTASGA